jgi:hypothetical protein
MLPRSGVFVAGFFERSDVSYEASVQKVLRNRVGEDRSIGSIRAPDTEFQMEWLPDLEGGPIRGRASVEILGMNTLQPPRTAFLLRRTAAILKPTLVEILTLAIRAKPPHHLRCCVSEGLEIAAILGYS